MILDKRLTTIEMKELEKIGKLINVVFEKQTEQEPCEDAISRQVVFNIIEKEQFKGDAIAEIEKLPPVTPKQRTGHNCNEDYADCDQFVCSECGIELQDWHRIERDEDDGEITCHEYVMKYCPNCGAKMVEFGKARTQNDN